MNSILLKYITEIQFIATYELWQDYEHPGHGTNLCDGLSVAILNTIGLNESYATGQNKGGKGGWLVIE